MFAVRGYQAVLSAVLAGVTLAFVNACSTDQTTDPDVTGVLLAKGGGPAPTVESTDPPGAPQDTTLDVLVFGSGFDDGSVAEFTLDGVPTTKVKTNSTQYLSPSQLKANVTVDLEAVVDLYDVEVMTTRGKKGIGVDLFIVVEKGDSVPAQGAGAFPPVPLIASFRDADGDKIKSDGRVDPYYGVYGYVDGSCGAEAELAKNSNLAWLFPHYTAIKPKERAACREARLLDVVVDNFPTHDERIVTDTTLSDGWLFRVDGVRQVKEGAPQIQIGLLQGGSDAAWKCRFSKSWMAFGFEGDSVQVIRQAADSWLVESTGEHRAVCTFWSYADTVVVVLPFQATFTLK